MDSKTSRQSLFPIVAGNILEWYDFALYGFFASTIAGHFFPAGNAGTAWLAATATFGAAFFMRPVGALLFGLIGDRLGRKSALTATILLMATGTAMIAFAPTYATAGIGATVTVVAGRLLQGLSASGEAGLAIAMLMESAHPSKRGVMGGWFAIGMYGAVLLGSLAALMVSSLLPPADAAEWGWRLPFIAGLLIVPIGFIARRTLAESREFLVSKASPGFPARLSRMETARGIGATMGLAAFGTAATYLMLIFMPAYAERDLGIVRQHAILSTFLASLLLVLLLLPAGRISGRVGQHRMVLGGTAFAGVAIVPFFMTLNASPAFTTLLALQLTLAVCMAAYASSAPVLMSAMFPVQRRALGVGLGYNLGILIFGGFAPFFSTWLITVTGNRMIPAYYVACAALLTIAVVLYPTFTQLRLRRTAVDA